MSLEEASSHTAGRSGGPDIDDPNLDWASIAVAAGFRRANAATVNYYSTTPETLRPYRMSNVDIQSGLWYHDTAPGPLYDGAPTTMRQRPFYVNVASAWDENIACIYPSTLQVGSILMMPSASRWELKGFAEGRSASKQVTLTVDDFNAALTHIWSTYEQMASYQNSITNLWYVHVPPTLLNSGTIETFGAWVDSINALMGVHGENPKAEWRNFNEIASIHSNLLSFYGWDTTT